MRVAYGVAAAVMCLGLPTVLVGYMLGNWWVVPSAAAMVFGMWGWYALAAFLLARALGWRE